MEFEKRPWDGAFALFNLEGTGQQLVYAFKFYGRPELARPFAALAKNSLKSEIDKIDMIVPVPLHWTRSFSRGYNQSALFCEEIAKSMNIKYSPVLRRIKRTRQQAKLDRKQRQKNLSGAFAIKAGTDLKNKTILLVDDVMTTGATLSAAARTFDNCDLKGLYTLVIGRR
jgi:ComF family protein